MHTKKHITPCKSISYAYKTIHLYCKRIGLPNLYRSLSGGCLQSARSLQIPITCGKQATELQIINTLTNKQFSANSAPLPKPLAKKFVLFEHIRLENLFYILETNGLGLATP